MEKHVVIEKPVINHTIVTYLYRLDTLLSLCEGVHDRRTRIQNLIETIRDENKTDFAKKKELAAFKKDLVGMNAFSDISVIPKDKNPYWKYPIEMQIKEAASQLWGIISDAH